MKALFVVLLMLFAAMESGAADGKTLQIAIADGVYCNSHIAQAQSAFLTLYPDWQVDTGASLDADILITDDRWYADAQPFMARYNSLYLNGQAADSCGFVLPSGAYGYAALLEAAEKAQLPGDTYVLADTLAFPHVLDILVNRDGKACFDGEELKYELAAFKALYQKRYITEDNHGAVSTLLLSGMWKEGYTEVFPLLGVSLADAYMAVVSEGSAHKEEAAAFIRCLADAAPQTEMQIWAAENMIVRAYPDGWVGRCITSGVMRAYLQDEISLDSLIEELKKMYN